MTYRTVEIGINTNETTYFFWILACRAEGASYIVPPNENTLLNE